MKKILRDLLILISLILLILFLWFHKGLIFAGGEEGIPFYDLNKTFQIVSYTWQDVSAGYPTQLILNRIPYFNLLRYIYSLGMPGFLVQVLHFFIIMSFGCISMYFLLKETISKELDQYKNNLYEFVPLIGAIFYLLNPFSMTQIWGRGLYLQFFPFALFPLFLLMFILGINNKNIIYGILGLLASVLFAGSFGNPSYIFSLWIIIGIYLFFYILKNRQLKDIIYAIFYYVALVAGWLLINAWWIYPFLKISQNQFSSALNNTEENIGTLKGISKDYAFFNLIRFIHEGYFFRDLKYGSSYKTILFQAISWLIPLALIFSIPVFKRLKYYSFYIMFLVAALFICLGSNLPLGKLFVFIFKVIPTFQAFRNPFEKFGVVLTIAYAPFFALGVIEVSQRVNSKFKKIKPSFTAILILFLICGVFLWPIWTGQFAGGLVFNPWVKVPDYYRDLDNWLNKQSDDGRMIHFPINPGDGLKYSGWEHSYQGIEPGEYLFTRSSIGKNGQSFKPYYNILLQRLNNFHEESYGPDPDLTNSEFRSDNLDEELAKLNVRYIILHHDIDPEIGNIGKPEPVINYLLTQKNIQKINTFELLDIYKVTIPDNVHLIYSPDINITYQKIDPTKYSVRVKDATEPFDLYFLENFDPNWEVEINGQKITNHEKVFSYGNKWRIQKSGDLGMTLKYKPQDYVDEGFKFTYYTVLIFSSICFLYVMRKYLIWRLKKKKRF